MLLSEIQQKFNNFAEKFSSPPPYGVKLTAKHTNPPQEVKDIASVAARNSAKIK